MSSWTKKKRKKVAVGDAIAQGDWALSRKCWAIVLFNLHPLQPLIPFPLPFLSNFLYLNLQVPYFYLFQFSCPSHCRAGKQANGCVVLFVAACQVKAQQTNTQCFKTMIFRNSVLNEYLKTTHWIYRIKLLDCPIEYSPNNFPLEEFNLKRDFICLFVS